MKKHIVCLGDSNTYGFCADPGDCADSAFGRFNEEERWTCLLQQGLGEEYLVIEEGLCGRTTVFDDPLHEGMSALPYLFPCLKSHEPVSLLIIMLGTNDTKEHLGANAACIGVGLERLVRKAMTVNCWRPKGKRNILVLAPPPILPDLDTAPSGVGMGKGCVEKSREIAHYFKQVADMLGVNFLDTAELGCEFNHVDYVHLTRASHAKLAEALIPLVKDLTKT